VSNVRGSSDAAGDALAQLEQHAGRLSVRIGDREGLVRLEIGDIGEAVGRIIDPGRSCRSLGLGRYHRRNRGSGGGETRTTQKSAAAGINHLVAMAHGVLLGRADTPTGGVSSGMTGTPTGRASLFLRFCDPDRHGPYGDMSRRLDMSINGNVLACHLSVI